METLVVPAGEGRAFQVAEGQRLRIITPEGQQAADFFAFRADDLSEWLSPQHTWMPTRALHPRAGDTFLSQLREPMLDFLEDGADGIHDLIIAPCDAVRYEQFGVEGHHRSCAENLEIAMRELGHEISVTPFAVNFFTNTDVEDGFMFGTPAAPVVKPGGYVVLEARMDLIGVVSACPYDLAGPGWSINAPDGPTEIVVELL